MMATHTPSKGNGVASAFSYAWTGHDSMTYPLKK